MNHSRLKETSKKYQNMFSIPLPHRRLPDLLILILLISLARATKPSCAFINSSNKKQYLTRHRQTSIWRNLVSSTSIGEVVPAGAASYSQPHQQEETSVSPPKTNPNFKSTNVLSKHFAIPRTSFVDKISPRPNYLWERMALALMPTQQQNRKDGRGKMGVDVTVEFRDAKDGATTLVQQCLDASNAQMDHDELESMIQYITNVLEYYQTHIHQKNALYKVRLVSTIGSKGQKCPRWHVDHVPLRLVMSLAGPGCVYIPYEKEVEHLTFVDRNALNGSDEADSTRANELILPHGEREIAVYAKEGDAVLLMGRAWERKMQQPSSSEMERDTMILAAPHRSPSLGSDELRVLLVVDYVSQD